ncbi:MAG: pyridoxal phosphate-dependent aminotransferase [Gemmatimonadaceae bacterium]|nr:pyridoxal phosphate-dependent aminotransferase [Gemmatimonadaceae bacterium]
MQTIDAKFRALATDNAPGQEVRQRVGDLDTIMRGETLGGVPVDFSHGDVDAFPPTPGSAECWNDGFSRGAQQAYTEYRGAARIRERLADRLGAFTGRPVSAGSELIITPGTQGALFLALGATVTHGTKVAVVEPDYFANRKLVAFFGGELVPIPLRYTGATSENGPDLDRIEAAFRGGTSVFVFSTPNNPTGVVFSADAIRAIAALAATHGVTLIVDQLYSRLLYTGESYTHLRACDPQPEALITIMGPSKTESLSGFRLGAAFGTPALIDRMERLQAIVSLRAAGYSQAALETWFAEPPGWMAQRIVEHEAIRDALLRTFRSGGLVVATPQAGSYLFPELPPLAVDASTFVRLLRHQAGVTVTPGTEFGPGLERSIRLNFSQDHAAAVAAAERIVRMVEVYRA